MNLQAVKPATFEREGLLPVRWVDNASLYADAPK
jgi:hypothetical protein